MSIQFPFFLLVDQTLRKIRIQTEGNCTSHETKQIRTSRIVFLPEVSLENAFKGVKEQQTIPGSQVVYKKRARMAEDTKRQKSSVGR